MLLSAWRVASPELPTLTNFGVIFGSSGESIRATQVVARLARHLGIEINVSALFEHRTIHSLIGYLDGSLPAEIELLARTAERAAKQSAILACRAEGNGP